MEKRVLRGYQSRLLETAKRENTIAVLPTGAGKTLLASALAVEATRRYPTRLVVFLVPTIPLVKQQQRFLTEDSTALGRSLEVGVCCGGKNGLHRGLHALICTPASFLNLLHASAIFFSDISLLIVDEAHHTGKQHPYAVIMRRYGECAEENRPRVLGLTASPGCTNAEIKARCRQLFANVASVVEDRVLSDELSAVVSVPALERARPEVPDDGKLDQLADAVTQQIESLSSPFYSTVLDFYIDEDQEAEDDLLIQPESVSQAIAAASDIILTLGTTHVQKFFDENAVFHRNGSMLKGVMDMCNGSSVIGLESSRLKVLKTILNRYVDDPTFAGIVFVSLRSTAYYLTQLLNEDPHYRHLQASMLLGHTNRTDNVRMTMAQQQDVVARFRNGQTKLLVATSVAEEGLDIPSCRLVVRLNARLTPIQMIQSRGRARYAESVYVIVCVNALEDEYIECAQAGEVTMHQTLKRMSAESLGFACETLWEQTPVPEHLTVYGSAKSMSNRYSFLYPPGNDGIRTRGGCHRPSFDNIDYKSVLNVCCSQRWRLSPSILNYETYRQGEDHCPLFKTVLHIKTPPYSLPHIDTGPFEGDQWMTKKKESEQRAAYVACSAFGLI
eukprot:GILJ01004539.1.p1 GENE.GILJ01004539.1~~GILJ01004539.1.p1  ORF type:complete len:615 (+),score=61.82 GILJ01004539.1:97-1941(+)